MFLLERLKTGAKASTPPECASIAEILVEAFVEEFSTPPECAPIREILVEECFRSSGRTLRKHFYELHIYLTRPPQL